MTETMTLVINASLLPTKSRLHLSVSLPEGMPGNSSDESGFSIIRLTGKEVPKYMVRKKKQYKIYSLFVPSERRLSCSTMTRTHESLTDERVRLSDKTLLCRR